MGFQNWRMAPVPISKPSPRPRTPWIELPRALAWFRLPPCLVVWDFGWHPVWLYGISAGPLSGCMGFQNWRMAPCPDLKPLPTPKSSLDWAAAGFSMVSAGPLSTFISLSKLTDGPLSRSQTPPDAQQLLGLSCRGLWHGFGCHLVWLYGISAGLLSGFMGFQNFSWPSVWFYGISKLTDGPLSRSQTPPHAQEFLGLSCGGL